jgi:hypothetical protein
MGAVYLGESMNKAEVELIDNRIQVSYLPREPPYQPFQGPLMFPFQTRLLRKFPVTTYCISYHYLMVRIRTSTCWY